MTGLIGISYKSADLEIRERFSFSEEEIDEISETCLKSGYVNGVVILSTCNRSEIYYSCPKEKTKQAADVILNELSVKKNYNSSLSSYFYFKENSEMVEHLFKVASGIDSMILGEDQIIGQVKEAFSHAEKNKSTDKILKRLFTKAFEIGKRVRTKTQINRGSASASAAAVNLAHQRFVRMPELHVMLIGAGQTGQLVLNNLRKAKFASLTVANRTYSKAEEVAKIYGGKAIKIEEIEKHLPECDLIFIATDAKEPIVKLETAKRAIQKRGNENTQSYFDLSVPRNIEDSVAQIEGIELFTIDDLQNIVQHTNHNRQKEIAAAMEIINKATVNFTNWEHDQELVPVILNIKKSFNKLNQAEMEEFMRIRSLKENDLLEEYSKHITEKFARVFIKNLKSVSREVENRKDFMAMAKEFFKI